MNSFLGFARGLHEVSLMMLFGSACLLALLTSKVPELALEGGVLTTGRRIAALTALVTAPVWLALTAAQMAGDMTAVSDSQTLWQVVSATLFGQIFLARLFLMLVLLAAVWLGRTRLTAWLSGLGLVLIAVTSHAAGASPFDFGFIGTASDGLHLVTGGYWIGSLCVLAVLLTQRPAAPRLGLAISVFAEWGMIAVALLVMTGIINAAMILLGMPGHDALPYLAVLGLKLVLVTVMIVLALVLPRLGQAGMVTKLKTHVGWELGLGLVVIGLAMALTILPPTLQ
jgi:putative copper resistance protein D